MLTIDKILTKAYSQYGAQMGRSNVGTFPPVITSGRNNRICKKHQTKVFECRVKLDTGGYDKGGAYWGGALNLECNILKTYNTLNFLENSNMTKLTFEQKAERMNVICNIQAMQQKLYGQAYEYTDFNANSLEDLRSMQNTLTRIYNDSLKK